MTKIITPAKFVAAFEEVVSNYQNVIMDKWNSPGSFSVMALGSKLAPGGLFPDIAAKLGLQYYREYYSLDAVLTDDKFDRASTGSPWLKYFAVALEHENQGVNSWEELCKLTYFHAPLKVVVTYPGHLSKDFILSDFREVLQAVDNARGYLCPEEYLVIFGTKVSKSVSWSFHTRADGNFVELQPP